jgi:hypothetical protein
MCLGLWCGTGRYGDPGARAGRQVSIQLVLPHFFLIFIVSTVKVLSEAEEAENEGSNLAGEMNIDESPGLSGPCPNLNLNPRCASHHQEWVIHYINYCYSNED